MLTFSVLRTLSNRGLMFLELERFSNDYLQTKQLVILK
jgi:hypothetical protein